MLALVAAVLLVCSLAGQARASRIAPGINAAGLRTLGTESRDLHLVALSSAGVVLVRSDASWGAPPPDDWVAALARHRLRWAPIIAYNDAEDPFTAPDDAAYAAYAASLVARYGKGGEFWAENPDVPYMPVRTWEVWNEPNSPQFWHPVDAERYAQTFIAAAAAIRAVDDQAQVMSGGLLGVSSPAFLEDFLAAGAEPDIVGFHPYNSQQRDIRESIEAVRAKTQLPIALTEIGWTDRSPEWWSRLLRSLPRWRLGVTQVMPYAWIDPTWGLAEDDGPGSTGIAFLATIPVLRAPR